MAEPGVQPVEMENGPIWIGAGYGRALRQEWRGGTGRLAGAVWQRSSRRSLQRPGLPQFQPLAKIEFSKTLRLEDLILARACAAGNERAWEVFLTRYREKLYDIARQITREDSTGRELADSVYAELYGTRMREGNRVSRLSYYGGRGSLDGWLRTVLAQEFVNTYRKQRRTVSLDEESEEGMQFAAVESETVVSADPRLEGAIDEALRSLPAEERFILASYFLDGRTLAQIARALVGARIHHQPQDRKAHQGLAQTDCEKLGRTGHEPPPGRRGPQRRRSRFGSGYSRQFGARFSRRCVL